MLAGENDEVYPITYIISLFSSTAPHPQLVQISETLVQLMGFATVFIIWGSEQFCFRSFSLLFLTTPVCFNSLLCLWTASSCDPKLHFLCGIYIPTSQDRGCSLSSGINGETLSKSVPNPENQAVRDYDTIFPLSNGHYTRSVLQMCGCSINMK